MLAFELNLSCVVGLRTIDVDFTSKFNPGDSEDTSGKTTGKRNHILLVMVQEGQLALANIMYCNLKDKNLNQVQVKPGSLFRFLHQHAHSLKNKIIILIFKLV